MKCISNIYIISWGKQTNSYCIQDKSAVNICRTESLFSVRPIGAPIDSQKHLVLSYSEREREMFYLTMHSTHFIYGYMASDIWLRTILIVRKETRCRHIGYSYRLTARVLLYAPSHRQDNTYYGLCYISHGALARTRNSSMGPPHEGSIRRPIAPRANALLLSYVPLPAPIDSQKHLVLSYSHPALNYFTGVGCRSVVGYPVRVLWVVRSIPLN